MNSFEYISVLISVLLGLAVTHLVVGIVSVIQNRETTRVYWVHLVWVVNVLGHITMWWWAFHTWADLDAWSMPVFYLLFGYSLVLSAIAGLLFPVHGLENDYRAFFFRQFRWFLGLQVLWLGIDVVEVMVKESVGLRPVPPDYFLLTIPVILGLLIGSIVKSPKYHAFLTLSVFLFNAYYAATIFVDIS